MRDVPRNAEGWPISKVSVTDLDGTVHETTQWWPEDVESHCGRWWITPIYGGCTRPERYELRLNHKVVGGGSTQRTCKADAEDVAEERGMAVEGHTRKQRSA